MLSILHKSVKIIKSNLSDQEEGYDLYSPLTHHILKVFANQ